jgi:penicillin amidase
MALLKKICLAIIVPAVLTIILVILTIPKRSGDVLLTSATYSPVHIYRDIHGTTTIKGDSIQEAYYGLGYAHAQDRLWQMHVHRMLFSGRMSEMFGDRLIELDKYMRTLAFKRTARKAISNCPKW